MVDVQLSSLNLHVMKHGTSNVLFANKQGSPGRFKPPTTVEKKTLQPLAKFQAHLSSFLASQTNYFYKRMSLDTLMCHMS